MNRRRASQSIVANPVLVGAVTTLVVIVAVFLAYNANNGLPFVPTKEYFVEMPNGANLVTGNEVRQGGFRIGVVTDMQPALLSNGKVGARLQVKLDKKVGTLPVDTTMKIRPRSSLGLKYLELTRGKSDKLLQDGDTVPVSQGRSQVDLDEFYNIFDEPTRKASQENLQGFGDTFAGRGVDLNRTIEALPRLSRHLEPVARNLANPNTQLGRFFRELGDAARIVAPVGKIQGRLFTSMADTFAALSRDPQALKDFIGKQPETLRVGTASLKVQKPFLADTADFSHSLRLASHELRLGLPDLNDALDTGTPVLERSVTLNDDLQDALAALNDLVQSPQTPGALNGLTDTVTTLDPQLKFYGPYQTVCNFWNYFWTFAAEHISEEDPTGSAQRALLNSTSQQANSLGSIGASEPANGENVIEGNAQYLHGQVYGAAVDSNGNADCENGQRGFPKRLARFGASKYNVAIDPHTPGNQGPTFLSSADHGKPLDQRALGRTHVPAGETFSRTPLTGPMLDPSFESEGR